MVQSGSDDYQKFILGKKMYHKKEIWDFSLLFEKHTQLTYALRCPGRVLIIFEYCKNIQRRGKKALENFILIQKRFVRRFDGRENKLPVRPRLLAIEARCCVIVINPVPRFMTKFTLGTNASTSLFILADTSWQLLESLCI